MQENFDIYLRYANIIRTDEILNVSLNVKA